MEIEKIMSKTIVTVEMDDSLKLVKEIFDNARFHHLLVVQYGKLFGVISDRDLLKAISPFIGTPEETNRDRATLKKRAHQILTRKPITLAPDAMIHDALRIFNSHNVSCIPIVDYQQRPVGIITWRDILRVLESIPAKGMDQ